MAGRNFSPVPFLLLVSFVLLGALPEGRALETLSAREFNRQVEADYRLQANVRTESTRESVPVSREADAAGACDGIINGKWGFHTDNDLGPWWQVDLGKAREIVRASIWNRCDNNTASRANHMLLRFSDDGKKWRTVYRHDGTPFYGMKDGRPLVITVERQTARYVRIELPGKSFLHLDEVEIFWPG